MLSASRWTSGRAESEELSPAKLLERKQKKAQPKALKAPVQVALDHHEVAAVFDAKKCLIDNM